ncbi:MAG: cytochrome c oxidase assembly protein, partial [Rhodobacteraceae bacterium]|nr:cytochrome c oxidase assembly protein [Paracoccaceae bacterium]
TPLEDQQLAGLVMWVPAGAIYLAAGLYLGWRVLDAAEQRARRAPPATSAAGALVHARTQPNSLNGPE